MRKIAVVFLGGMICACDGGVIAPGGDASAADSLITLADGAPADAANDLAPSPKDATGGGADLPASAGDPCPGGKCAGSMLCLAGRCHTSCNQTDTKCNDRVKECKASEFCGQASSFADACYPTKATVGSKCGKGLPLCPGGSLCVQTSTKTACLQLCKYGCTGGTCGKTTTGCSVCVK